MELETGRKKKPSRLSSMLGPGFRFHPTDEELVQFYLRRKASGKSFQFDAIADVDVYKTEPWDLPCMSKLKSRDLEWYFFSFLDKKYGNGARTNRATGKGYWKTTGKDRAVYHKKQIVGMKKTLVYHCGRAPKGERSNWVMHEYRLVGCESEASGVAQDSFVICRIFQKSGTGPKNGEQYGAPFEEEEWDNDELELVPQFDAIKEVNVGDNSHLNSHDFHQILESDAPLNMAPPISPQSADDSCNVEASKSFGDTQNLSKPTISYDPKTQNSPISNGMDDTQIQKSGDFDDLSFLLNDPFLDSFDKFDDGFIETNDLSNPSEAKTSTFDMLDEYLDAGDDTSFYFSSDPAMNFVSNQTFLPQMGLDRGSEQPNFPSGQIMENVSRKLGNINAPPAFAAEFPSKDAILRLNSVARSTASGKGTRVGFVIGKAVSAICRGWLCFIFLWILMSFRGSTNIGVK